MPSIGSYKYKCLRCSKWLSTIHRKPCTDAALPFKF